MSKILTFGFLILNFVISEISCTTSGFQFQLPDASVDPFFGRHSFLKRFDNILKKEGAVVITGIKGVGKTETVLKYIHGSARETETGSTTSYDNHIWIDGETVESLKEGFWKLSQLLDTNLANSEVNKGQDEFSSSPSATTTTKELAALVYQKIQVQNKLKGNTLIVFDNVNSKNVDILEFLPEKNPNEKSKDKIQNHGKIHTVITSQNIAADWGPLESIPLNPFVFPEILEILLDQVGISSESEREELETFFMERMSGDAVLSPWSTLEVPHVVEFIKERTLYHMDKPDPDGAMDKMEAFVMAIQDYFNRKPSNTDVKYESDSESDKKGNATSKSQSKPQPVKLERDNIKMLEKFADTLERDGEIEGALEMTEAIAHSQKMALGEEHEETLDSNEKIARLLTKLDQNDEALNIYQKVYQIRKRLLGPDHFQTIESLEGVAGVLVLMEEWEEAVDLLQEAYDWNERVLGEDHKKTRISHQALLRAKKELEKEGPQNVASKKDEL